MSCRMRAVGIRALGLSRRRYSCDCADDHSNPRTFFADRYRVRVKVR